MERGKGKGLSLKVPHMACWPGENGSFYLRRWDNGELYVGLSNARSTFVLTAAQRQELVAWLNEQFPAEE